MANPNSPTNGQGSQLGLLVNTGGTAVLPLADGSITAGGASTPAAMAGAAIAARGSNAVPAFGYEADTFTPFSLTGVTTGTTIWTPASGKKWRLLGAILKSDIATDLTFTDGTAGTTKLIASCAAGAPIHVPLGHIGIVSGTVNTPLRVAATGTAALKGTLWGIEE